MNILIDETTAVNLDQVVRTGYAPAPSELFFSLSNGEEVRVDVKDAKMSAIASRLVARAETYGQKLFRLNVTEYDSDLSNLIEGQQTLREIVWEIYEEIDDAESA